MTLEMVVEAEQWRAHLHRLRADVPGLIPVAKGNGYGFGIDLLAAEAAALDVGTLAVGTYAEIGSTADFPGAVLVLSPWRPSEPAPLDDPRVVHTVSRLEDLAMLAATGRRPRVVLEVATSMRRHGIDAQRLDQVVPHLPAVQALGWALHLPLTGDTVGQARTLTQAARAVADLPVWVSHVPADRLDEVGDRVRLRSGTLLWLGAPGALVVQASVLDRHDLQRGDRFGYRQRRARRPGTLLVVSGGTSHGIGLRAPSPATSVRRRGVALADGGLDALGQARSPFVVGGRHAWFAEPPHMQCSLVWVPSNVPAPAVGDVVPARVRHTTTLVDRVVLV